jgi:hypothetical protein
MFVACALFLEQPTNRFLGSGEITTFIDSGWEAIRGKVISKTALRDESDSLKR